MKSKLITVVGLIYVVLAIFVTKFLLDRNDFGVYELGDSYYMYNSSIVEFNKTSLVHFEKKGDYGNLVGEEVYYFNNDKILKKDELLSFSKDDKSFTVQSGEYGLENFLGKPDRGYFLLGSLLGFFTTKAVYLCLIIIPVFILLVYEVYLLFVYIKKDKKRKVLDDGKKGREKE